MKEQKQQDGGRWLHSEAARQAGPEGLYLNPQTPENTRAVPSRVCTQGSLWLRMRRPSVYEIILALMHDWKEPARKTPANWTLLLRKALVSKKRSVIFHYLATEANQELRCLQQERRICPASVLHILSGTTFFFKHKCGIVGRI